MIIGPGVSLTAYNVHTELVAGRNTGKFLLFIFKKCAMPKIKVTSGHVVPIFTDTVNQGSVVGFLLNSDPPNTQIPTSLTITLTLAGRNWGAQPVPANTDGANLLLKFQSTNLGSTGNPYNLTISSNRLGWTLEGDTGTISFTETDSPQSQILVANPVGNPTTPASQARKKPVLHRIKAFFSNLFK